MNYQVTTLYEYRLELGDLSMGKAIVFATDLDQANELLREYLFMENDSCGWDQDDALEPFNLKNWGLSQSRPIGPQPTPYMGVWICDWYIEEY